MSQNAEFDWEESLSRHIAARLKEHCDRLTTAEVAKRAGLSKATLYTYLRRDSLPNVAALFALERSLKTSLYPLQEVMDEAVAWALEQQPPGR